MNIEDLRSGELYYALHIDYTIDETSMYMFIECGYEGISKEEYARDFPHTNVNIKNMKYYLFYLVNENTFKAYRFNDNEPSRYRWIEFITPIDTK